MDLRDEDLTAYIQEQLNEFSAEATKMLGDSLDRKHKQITGKTKSSLKINTFNPGRNTSAAELIYSLGSKGLDSRKRIAHNMTLDDAIEWVKGRGLADFEYIPGYKDKVPSLDIAARRLAFVMLRSSRGERPEYSTSWLHRPFFGLWAEYRRRIKEAFILKTTQYVGKDIEGAFLSVRGKNIRFQK